MTTLEQLKADQDAAHQLMIIGIEAAKKEVEQQLEQTEETNRKL